MKVGFADYYEPKSNDWIVVESARETFIATINTVAPEVPRELLATLQETQANSRIDLKSAVLAWGERFHLQDSWCQDVAVRTLMGWSACLRSPDRQANRGQPLPMEGLPQLDAGSIRQVYFEILNKRPRAVPPTLQLDGWRPFLQSSEDYLDRAIADLRDQLADYVKALDERFRLSGWQSVPDRRMFGEHCEWLVKYQVLGYSHGRIADEYSGKSGRILTDNAITKAIPRAASLLRLTLRSPKPLVPGSSPGATARRKSVQPGEG
jgi:hypothetical protein